MKTSDKKLLEALSTLSFASEKSLEQLKKIRSDLETENPQIIAQICADLIIENYDSLETEEKQNSLQNFVYFLSLTPSSELFQKIIRFLSAGSDENNLNTDEFNVKSDRSIKEIVSLLPFVSEAFGARIVDSLIQDNQKISQAPRQEIESLISTRLFNDLKLRAQLLTIWISTDNKTLEDAKFALECIKESEEDRSEIALNFLADTKFELGKYSIRPKRVLEDFESLIFEVNPSERLQILVNWISQHNLSLADLKAILSFVKNSEIEQSTIINSFFIKEVQTTDNDQLNKSKKFEDLIEILNLLKAQNSKSLDGFAEALEVSNNFSFEFLKKLLTFVDESRRSKIIVNWFANGERSSECLDQALQILEGDEEAKNQVIEKFFFKENPKSFDYKQTKSFDYKRTTEEINLIIPKVKSDKLKAKILTHWVLGQKNNNVESLKFALSLLENSEQIKLQISYLFFFDFDEKASPKFKRKRTIESLKEILPLLGRDAAHEILQTWVNGSHRNFINALYQNLIPDVNIYDATSVVDAYFRRFGLPLENFFDVTKVIYRNIPQLQPNSIIYAIRALSNRKDGLKEIRESKTKILEFIEEIPDITKAKIILTDLYSLQSIMPREIFDAASKYVSKNYPTMYRALDNHSVEQAYIARALDEFHIKFESLNKSETKIAQIFSHLYFCEDALEKFKLCLKSAVLQEIRDQFPTSDSKVLILEQDFRLLYQLLKSDIFAQSQNNGINNFLNIPSVKVVSDPLKAISLPNYPADKIDLFRFGDNELTSRDQLENGNHGNNGVSKTDQFIALLRETNFSEENNSSERKLADFFESILRLEEKIPQHSLKSLNQFFQRDKFLLAGLFSKQGGLDKFLSLINTAGDGCFANIGTHVRLALIDSSIEDIGLQALASVFNQYISYPILSYAQYGRGVDHPSEGSEASTIFTDSRVNKNFISPKALVNKLKEEFFVDGQKIRNSWLMISRHYGFEDVENTITKLLLERIEDRYFGQDNYRDLVESKMAEFAVLLIIEKHLPTLLENRHLKEFLQEVGSLKDGIENSLSPSVQTSPSETTSLSAQGSSHLSNSNQKSR